MKKLIFFCAVLAALLFTGCNKSKNSRENQLIIYSYNSFSGDWCAGPQIAKLFTEKTGIQVIFTECGDSGQLLARAISEQNEPYADLVIGFDNSLVQKVLESTIFLPYKPANADDLIPDELYRELNPNGMWLITPYDYSYFSFIYNTQSEIPAPECLEDLTKDVYRKKVILMDARTSTVGMGFDAWINKVYGDDASAFMKRLEPSVLTVSPGWSIGYGMFTNGEAPLVISYTTSPAYHIDSGEGNMYKALPFTDGHVRQVEGAAIIRNAPNSQGARRFLDLLISEEAQKLIPKTQWMYPVNSKVELPECYNECSQALFTHLK